MKDLEEKKKADEEFDSFLLSQEENPECNNQGDPYVGSQNQDNSDTELPGCRTQAYTILEH